MGMHELIKAAILDGDFCSILDKVEYSTNPRKLVTVQDMIEYNENKERLERRIKAVMGA